MFNAEFLHVKDKCTFEVLAESFSLVKKSIKIISEIIHDLDLKDAKFNRTETAGIAMVLDGMIKRESSDQGRMNSAFILFDDLYESLKRSK
jgi:hypothetical protein